MAIVTLPLPIFWPFFKQRSNLNVSFNCDNTIYKRSVLFNLTEQI